MQATFVILANPLWVIIVRCIEACLSQIFVCNFCFLPFIESFVWDIKSSLIEPSLSVGISYTAILTFIQWFLLFFEVNLCTYRQLWLTCHCVSQRSPYFPSVTGLIKTTFINLVTFSARLLCQLLSVFMKTACVPSKGIPKICFHSVTLYHQLNLIGSRVDNFDLGCLALALASFLIFSPLFPWTPPFYSAFPLEPWLMDNPEGLQKQL